MNTKNLNGNVTDYYSRGKTWVRLMWVNTTKCLLLTPWLCISCLLIIHPPLSWGLWRNNDLFKFNANVTKYMLSSHCTVFLFPTEMAILFNESNFRGLDSYSLRTLKSAFFTQPFLSDSHILIIIMQDLLIFEIEAVSRCFWYTFRAHFTTITCVLLLLKLFSKKRIIITHDPPSYSYRERLSFKKYKQLEN